jgi:DNA-binding MarR family transcriptional regulator
MPLSSKRREAMNSVPPRHRVPAHLARRFHQICLGAIAEIILPAGITPSEYAVLAVIIDLPNLDQQSLAKQLGIDPVSAGQMIARLEASGYLERRIAPHDRRARLLVATRAGAKLRESLRGPALAAQNRILEPLSVRERRSFLELLTRVVEGNQSYARPGNGRRPPRRMSASSKEIAHDLRQEPVRRRNAGQPVMRRDARC